MKTRRLRCGDGAFHFSQSVRVTIDHAWPCRRSLPGVAPVHAFAYADVLCTSVSTFTAVFRPQNGLFGEGTAKVHIDAEPNAELFEKLRVLRKSIADAEAVPAYIVFSDAVLRAIAASVPTTERDLLAISGVGPVKLERYGARFLELLRT